MIRIYNPKTDKAIVVDTGIGSIAENTIMWLDSDKELLGYCQFSVDKWIYGDDTSRIPACDPQAHVHYDLDDGSGSSAYIDKFCARWRKDPAIVAFLGD